MMQRTIFTTSKTAGVFVRQFSRTTAADFRALSVRGGEAPTTGWVKDTPYGVGGSVTNQGE